MKLIPFPSSKSRNSPSSSTITYWAWPNCGGEPETLSFRAQNMTMNSIFVSQDSLSITNSTQLSESEVEFTNALIPELEKESISIENVIRGVKSERLFFEPGETSSSILGGDKLDIAAPNNTNTSSTCKDIELKNISNEEDSTSTFVVMEMDSSDPFEDFKESMGEIVKTYEFESMNLEWLEEMLELYLRVNRKWNHGYIIGAFIDLLVTLDCDFIFSLPSSSSPCEQLCDISDGDSQSQSTTCVSRSPVSASSFSSVSKSIDCI